jgi:hypothetical protein
LIQPLFWLRKSDHNRRGRHTLGTGAVSSNFIRRVEHFVQLQQTWKHWLKWLTGVDVERQLILA